MMKVESKTSQAGKKRSRCWNGVQLRFLEGLQFEVEINLQLFQHWALASDYGYQE